MRIVAGAGPGRCGARSAAFALATVFGALLLGRWWDSLLRRARSIRSRVQQLRLGVVLGVAVTVLFVLAMVTDVALISWLTWIAFMALTFQGCQRRIAAAPAAGSAAAGWRRSTYC
jgi:hypothetical protein